MISVIIDENDDDEDENDLGFDEQIGIILYYFFSKTDTFWKIWVVVVPPPVLPSTKMTLMVHLFKT